MEIEGHCRACGHRFDAHWDKYPELPPIQAIFVPYCPKCKSKNVWTITDEANDFESSSGDDEVNFEDGEL